MPRELPSRSSLALKAGERGVYPRARQVRIVQLVIGLLAGLGGLGCGSSSSSSFLEQPPSGLPQRQELVASGIPFYESGSTAEQCRPSLVPVDGGLLFSGSIESPVEHLDLATGQITPLVHRFLPPRRLALRGEALFWADSERLVRTPLGGGSDVVLADGNRLISSALLVDDDAAYWVRGATGTWEIEKVTPSGNLALAQAAAEVVALAQDESNIYWEENDPGPLSPTCTCGSTIKKVSKAGGQITTLVDGYLNGRIPSSVPEGSPGSWWPAGGLAIDGANVFFVTTSYTGDTLWSVPTSGGELSPISLLGGGNYVSATTPRRMAADDTGIFWIDSFSLWFLAWGSGGPVSLATDLQRPVDLTLGEDTVVVVEQGALSDKLGYPLRLETGRVQVLPREGGTTLQSVSGLDDPSAAAVDASKLYWVDGWRVASASRTEGSIVTLASGIQDPMPRIAVVGGRMLVADGPYLKAFSVGGGQAEKVGLVIDTLPGPADPDRAVDLVADENGVFVAFLLGDVAVRKIPLDGGPVIDFWLPYPFNIGYYSWIVRLAMDQESAYVLTGEAGEGGAGTFWYPAIFKMPRAGGAPTLLLHHPIEDFTLVGRDIFFLTYTTCMIGGSGTQCIGENELRHLSLDTGEVETVAEAGGTILTGNSNQLAWFDPMGQVDYAWSPRSHHTAEQSSTSPSNTNFLDNINMDELVSDGRAFYFTFAERGQIWRASP